MCLPPLFAFWHSLIRGAVGGSVLVSNRSTLDQIVLVILFPSCVRRGGVSGLGLVLYTNAVEPWAPSRMIRGAREEACWILAGERFTKP